MLGYGLSGGNQPRMHRRERFAPWLHKGSHLKSHSHRLMPVARFSSRSHASIETVDGYAGRDDRALTTEGVVLRFALGCTRTPLSCSANSGGERSTPLGTNQRRPRGAGGGSVAMIEL